MCLLIRNLALYLPSRMIILKIPVNCVQLTNVYSFNIFPLIYCICQRDLSFFELIIGFICTYM